MAIPNPSAEIKDFEAEKGRKGASIAKKLGNAKKPKCKEILIKGVSQIKGGEEAV